MDNVIIHYGTTNTRRTNSKCGANKKLVQESTDHKKVNCFKCIDGMINDSKYFFLWRNRKIQLIVNNKGQQ